VKVLENGRLEDHEGDLNTGVRKVRVEDKRRMALAQDIQW
jgi:hypothetical protein